MKGAFFMQKGARNMADTNTPTTTPAGSTNKPLTGSLLNSATKPVDNKPTSSPVMKPVEPAKDPK